MERSGRILKNTLLVSVALGISFATSHISGSEVSAEGESTEPVFTSARTVDLTGKTITISDFAGRTDIINRLGELAELDDVDKERECSAMSGMGDFLVTGFDAQSEHATSIQKTAMLYNTWYLQQLIYCASKTNGAGRTTIKLPEGSFYFVSGHKYMAEGSTRIERHVIKPHNNIVLTGAGTEINSKKTVLKPYSEKSEFDGIDGGLDMFFFNDYSAYNLTSPNYLKDVHYSNFVIDSAETAGVRYNTAGKGFMINLFENNTWYNITVQNTDATGFGVDCPMGDSWIDNSRAYGNGKGVWSGDGAWGISPGVERGGGSGFGIGTGYSDSEHFEIRNSIAKGNGIFGFFYEHQDRFNANAYKATSANGFTITNSAAESNTWNYGGLRANDVTLSNVTSNAGNYTQSNGNNIKTIRHIHFSDESRNIKVSNVNLGGTVFSDINPTEWYADAVLWAEKYGIAGDAIAMSSTGQDNYAKSTRFEVGTSASRADIVAMIWHMMNYQGQTLSQNNGNLSDNQPNVITEYTDVEPSRPYAAAVKWASDKGITNGVGDSHFYNAGDATVKRSEVVTMLYRLAGSPSVGEVEDFKDVTDKSSWYYKPVQWAVQNKITNGVGDNTFAPDAPCTREQLVAFLYRYWTQFLCTENCPNIDMLLDVHHNE